MEGDKENNSKSTIETSSSHDEVLPGKKTSSTSTEAPMMANVEKATGNVVTVNDGNSKNITQKPCSNAILVINNDKGEMLQTYWSIVTNNPSDFMAWTRLLQLTEQQDDIDAATRIFDKFLMHYPYCYGYWRKYSNYLKKHGLEDKCELVLQKGVKAVPLSVDLWMYYCDFMASTYIDDLQKVTKCFEMALKFCGLHFRSDPLWEQYIKWLAKNNDHKSLTALYSRWMSVPTRGYEESFKKFKEFVTNNSPIAILRQKDFLALCKEVVNENSLLSDAIIDGAHPEGETSDALKKFNEEQKEILQKRIIKNGKKIYLETVQQAVARWNYEEAIKRPYFHVKPLGDSQLENWENYLKFEKKNGTKERIIILYERCLVPCALYEQFWLDYVEYLLSLNDASEQFKIKIRNVFDVACSTYHQNNVSINLEWAVFEESEGNPDKAATILDNLNKLYPKEVMIMLPRIYLEKRRGNFDKCHELFKNYIDNPELDSTITEIMIFRYASFCAWVIRDIPLSISILKDAIYKYKNYELYRDVFNFHLGSENFNLNDLIAAIDEALNNDDLPIEYKAEFSKSKFYHLVDYDSDINRILNAKIQRDKYQQLYRATVKTK